MGQALRVGQARGPWKALERSKFKYAKIFVKFPKPKYVYSRKTKIV